MRAAILLTLCLSLCSLVAAQNGKYYAFTWSAATTSACTYVPESKQCYAINEYRCSLVGYTKNAQGVAVAQGVPTFAPASYCSAVTVPTVQTTCDCPNPVTGTYSAHAYDMDPWIDTMPGLCRHTAEQGRKIACVKPGGYVEVHARLQNNGTGHWIVAPGLDNAFQLDLLTNNDEFPYWTPSALKLQAPTAPGQDGTFVGFLKAPAVVGLHSMYWQMRDPLGNIFATVHSWVEITCSDGVFCNGMERFVNGKCVNAVRAQCDDGEVCTTDTCDEETMTCRRIMDYSNPNCTTVPSCKVAGGEICTPNCVGKECGADGCGGLCGPNNGLCVDRMACSAEQKCVADRRPGSCDAPFRLIADGEKFLGRHTVDGDTSTGLQQVAATCNPLATAGQVMFTFTVPNDGVKYAIDARVSNGPDSTLDTIMELRTGQCFDPTGDEPAFIQEGEHQNVWCSDDSSPPGGLGSRVATFLKNGVTYFIVVGGYNADTVGPFTLDVRITENYIPSCLSRWCGPDGGGGDCGPCPGSLECDQFLRCSQPKTSTFCTTDRCQGGAQKCGDDGCGGSCGECPAGQVCPRATGICRPAQYCDHFRPRCQGCTTTQFCGTDCQCHELDEHFGDVRADRDRLLGSIVFREVEFDNFTCAYAEGCISGTGPRKLLRFETTTINQGTNDLPSVDPGFHPEEFTWGLCHNHYHSSGYSTQRLISTGNVAVARGHKTGYCLQDSNRLDYLQGPNVPCTPVSTCDVQGLSRGWYDVYGNDIDCQWIDITDIPSGEYTLRLHVNEERRLLESTHENNAVSVQVQIP